MSNNKVRDAVGAVQLAIGVVGLLILGGAIATSGLPTATQSFVIAAIAVLTVVIGECIVRLNR